QHLTTCTASARQVMQAYPIFGVFIDAHMVELVDWLCDYNLAHADDPVRFVGFDAQQPQDDHAELVAYLSEVATDDAADLVAGLASCDRTYSETFTAEQHAACTDG